MSRNELIADIVRVLSYCDQRRLRTIYCFALHILGREALSDQ